MNCKIILATLLMSTVLVSCSSNNIANDGSSDIDDSSGGDDGSSGGDDGSSGSDDGSSGGDNSRSAVNPLVTGELPSTKTTFYSVDPFGTQIEFTLDPDDKTLIVYLTSSDQLVDATITGSYDPETGEITADNCQSNVTESCEHFEPGTTSNFFEKYTIGDGLVALVPDELSFFGVSPTLDENMPNGKATYLGSVSAGVSYYDSELGDIVYDFTTGTAITSVDFDKDQLNAEFNDFDGDYAGSPANLDGAVIDGHYFSGGQLSIFDQDGNEIHIENTDAAGQFFGENAEELGGSLYADGEGYSSGFDALWNGVKQ